MATATRQNVGTSGTGITALQTNITSTLAGSVVSVGTSCGGNAFFTLSAPTDTASQTYTVGVAQTNAGAGTDCGQRIDHVLNSVSGVTSVTVHATTATELSSDVKEITGTANAVIGTTPAQTSSNSASSLATNSIVASAGDALAAFVTDSGGGTTQYSVSPAAYSVDSGVTPNGANERAGGAHADNVSAATLACTFTLPAAAACVAGQVGYQAAVGAVFDPSTVPWPPPAQQPIMHNTFSS